jgi:hypothetical protein
MENKVMVGPSKHLICRIYYRNRTLTFLNLHFYQKQTWKLRLFFLGMKHIHYFLASLNYMQGLTWVLMRKTHGVVTSGFNTWKWYRLYNKYQMCSLWWIKKPVVSQHLWPSPRKFLLYGMIPEWPRPSHHAVVARALPFPDNSRTKVHRMKIFHVTICDMEGHASSRCVPCKASQCGGDALHG